MKKSEQVQLIVFDYFKDDSIEIFSEIVEKFVFGIDSDSDSDSDTNASRRIESFLRENDLQEAFINYHLEVKSPGKYFARINGYEVEMIQHIQTAILVLHYHKSKAELGKVKSKDGGKIRFLKNQLYECYEALHRSDSYFDGKEEDEKMLEKIKNL